MARAAIHNASIERRRDLTDPEYFPPPLSEAEIRAIVDEAVVQTGAKGPADMGRVMGVVMPKVRTRADGSLVQRIVRGVLGTPS
jgi:uncharacterized protein YqeY